MWYLILRDDVLNRPDPRLLEIGVYKGQVISLWALIASQSSVVTPKPAICGRVKTGH